MSELERALAFEEARRERCAEHVVPFRFGSAIFNDSFPRVWYLNLLRIDRPDGATLEALADEAERLQGARGHEHRRVVVPDDDAGLRLAPGFRSLGWKLEREVVMAFGGRGEKGGGAATAEEVTWEVLRPLREEVARNDPRATEEVVRELLDANALAAQAGRARQFAVRVKGRIVSAADLYSDGRTAQVEDVVTLTQYRGHGYATAVVLRAVQEAVATGHDLVFLVSDDEDWPKDLYARLGFEPIGRRWSFLKAPPGAGGSKLNGARAGRGRATGAT
jgi:ribosomal protein S18 acetylase RimI-like enzyme